MENDKTMNKTAYEKPYLTVMEWAQEDVLTVSELGTQWQDSWDMFSE